MPHVREATPDDAENVRAVWSAVAAEGEWIGTELPLSPDWVDRFRAAVESENSTWFVLTDDEPDEPDEHVRHDALDGDIVGAIFVQDAGGLAHIGMAILDGHRGRGLGRELMTVAIDWARERSCHKVALEVWPHNNRARRLYESFGFLDEGHFRRHYRRRNGELWDAISMGLVLDGDAPGRS